MLEFKSMGYRRIFNELSTVVVAFIIALSTFLIVQTAFIETVSGAGSTANVTSTVTVGNSTPTVSAVSINGGSDITLIANATTTIYINFTVTDVNGCNDVFLSGNTTGTAFRAGVGALCTADNRNCYTVSTTTHNCSANASTSVATATIDIYYFADATAASSSYPTQYWEGYAAVRDASGATSSATSTGVEVNVLTALEVTTSSINYGTVSANSDTGATNQTATTTNAGNSSTTLRLHAVSTLTSGSNSISTSSQRYSTSSFTYAGTSTALTDTAATVSGFFLTNPTSTSAVPQPTFWGLQVGAGTPTGTYNGITRFTSLWQP